MITLNQAERLVRRIAEMTAQPASDTQSAKLAQDYADLCRDSNRRLEQCAIMIEAGQSLQALQLAETPPPLLDLITVLGFRQAAEWRAFCQSHHLPWTEPFYDKYVRLLNSAYNKGIAGNHPFYSDYRQAVMDHNDDRAISIMRVIARMNPADANTKEELKRLEEKLLRGKLENLRQVLSKGDSAAAQAQLAQIEASGLPVPSAHPVWQQAQLARCQQLLRRAEELRQQDAWQETEALVEEIHAFATQNKVQMPADDADSWTALEAWTLEKRAAYADDQDFQRAVSTLEYEVQSFESRQATGTQPGLAEAANVYNSLTAKWRDAERFNRPLDAALAGRYQQVNDWLQQRMRVATKRKRLVSIAVTLLVLGAVAAAVPFALDWSQQRDILRRLGTLESSRRVADTEAFVKGVPPRLKTKPQMADGIAQAQGFLAREMELKRTFDTNLSGLRQSDMAQPGARRAQCESTLTNLAPEFQPAGRSNLMAWDAQWQTVRNRALSERLDRAETIAAGLQGTNGYETVNALLPRLESALADMAPWKTEPPEVDANLLGRFLAVSNQFTLWKGRTEQWVKAQAALLNAQSLDDYLSRLAQLVLSPFASDAQRQAAAGISRLKLDKAAFLGELLLPNNDPANWHSLTNPADWRTAFMPETPTPQEKEKCFTLRDDKNMQNVYAWSLISNSAFMPVQTNLIFSQGIINDTNGHYIGLIYDTNPSPNTVNFVPNKRYDDIQFGVRMPFFLPECETFSRLGLGDLIDPNTGNYKTTILHLLDRLNNETNSRAVFRAYVALKLFDLADLRPEEWGLRWSPGAAQYRQALIAGGAMDLKSGDWMVRSRLLKYETPLQKCFQQARAVSLENQARFLEQLVRLTCLADFSVAGYVDGDGRPVLRQGNSPASDYWGWGKSPAEAILLFHRTSGNHLNQIAQPLPFTPLFVFGGDRQNLVNKAARDVPCNASDMAAILPPFFAPSHE